MVKPHGLNRAPGLKLETSVGQFFKFYDEIMYQTKVIYLFIYLFIFIFIFIFFIIKFLNILFTLGLHTEIIEK